MKSVDIGETHLESSSELTVRCTVGSEPDFLVSISTCAYASRWREPGMLTARACFVCYM